MKTYLSYMLKKNQRINNMKLFAFLIIFNLYPSTLLINAQTNELKKSRAGLLWKITGNGLNKTSYIFGTMHTVDESFIDKVPNFRNAIKNTTQTLYERDILSEKPNDILKMEKSFLMPKDTTYEMMIDKEDYKYLDSVMKRNTTLVYTNYKPLFWYDVISRYKKNSDAVNSGIYNIIDMAILKQTKDIYHHSIVYIEPKDAVNPIYEKWWSFWYNQPLKFQMYVLLNEVKKINEKSNDSVYINLKYAYENQDIEEVSELLQKNSEEKRFNTLAKDSSLFTQNIIKNQNAFMYNLGDGRTLNWLPKVEQEIKLTSSFIVVGLGHMIGENGLINQLRKKGYTVEPY